MTADTSTAMMISDEQIRQQYPLTAELIIQALDMDRETKAEAARHGKRYAPKVREKIAAMEAEIGQPMR